jgi:anti-sigma-K factor RskA
MNGREQAAAYALGELTGAEREEFDARLAREPDLRAEVDATRAAMSALEDLPEEAWPEVAAASAADAAVVGIAGTDGRGGEPDRADHAPPPTARRPRFLALRPAWAVAAVVLALAVGGAIGALVASGGSSSSSTAPTAIVLRPLDAPDAARGDISMPAAETMLLEVHGLPSSGDGAYYEVWLMNDAESLVPVASFRVGHSGTAKVEVPLPADPGAYRYFDVSRQTVGGGTAHSGDSVLRGPA